MEDQLTEQLYNTDAYLRECEATVTDVTDGGVVLDRTVFYPGGGGQPNDIGVLVKADGADSFSAALTNLKLDITHPLYRKVKNYRDEVANALAQPDDAPNVNSATFRMGSLYGKK